MSSNPLEFSDTVNGARCAPYVIVAMSVTRNGGIKMLLYLDLCCFNRPFDDQTQSRIRFETEAKLLIQQRVRDGTHSLVWSHVLQYENSMNPFPDRRQSIQEWRKYSAVHVTHSDALVLLSQDLMALGIKEFDALHVALAMMAQADLFITTDDRLAKKLKTFHKLPCLSPWEALACLENWYEN